MPPIVLYLDTAVGIGVFLALMVCAVYTLLGLAEGLRDLLRGRK
jgi:hypothetical protein